MDYRYKNLPTTFRTLVDLEVFHVSEKRGFLPKIDPLQVLPETFAPWEELAHDLPKYLAQGKARQAIGRLPLLDTYELRGTSELNERAMLLLSYFGHAYVFGDKKPSPKLPACIAVPWQRIAQRLSRPPVLSYTSYALHNWRRLNQQGPIALGNVALLQNFLGGMDEEWFILVHVDIEAKAAPLFPAILKAQKAVHENDSKTLTQELLTIAATLRVMQKTMERMPKNCDPYIYYHRVRPYIHGWKDNPVLPKGLLYEGVAAYEGKPQRFRGETGAQSTIIPSLDAALGIVFRDENERGEKDLLLPYLREMNAYMPVGHRMFRAAIEHGPSVREFTLRERSNVPALLEAYNACVHVLAAFRLLHFTYAGSYINTQSRKSQANPTDIGTGGTPFMQYLKKHYDETRAHVIT